MWMVCPHFMWIIQMTWQDLFSLKNNEKKKKKSAAAVVIGTLRVKN